MFMRRVIPVAYLGAGLCLLGSLLALGAFFLPAYGNPPWSLWETLVLLVYIQPHLQLGLVPPSVSILLLLLLSTTMLAFLAVFWRSHRRSLVRWHGSLTLLTLLFYVVATLINLFDLAIGLVSEDTPLSEVAPSVNIGVWLIPLSLLLALFGSLLLADSLEHHPGIVRLGCLFAFWPFEPRQLFKLLSGCLVIVVLSVSGLGFLGRGPLAFLGSPLTEFAVPTSLGGPEEITLGSDGNLWFTEVDGNKIGRITPSGIITEFAVPSFSGEPEGITLGPDGNLWFTEMGDSTIGRITPGGVITEFPLPTPYSVPEGITSGPDGALWFTERNGDRIGRITPQGALTEFSLPPNSAPAEITTGPDGALWFTERTQIGRITPQGVMTEFAVPTPQAGLGAITTGPDGNLWFTEQASQKIGRITPSGIITEFPVSPYAVNPADLTFGGIAVGADSALWFTDAAGDQIGRITPGGAISLFPLPASGSTPAGITAGPHQTVWFTEKYGNRLGRITLRTCSSAGCEGAYLDSP